MTTRPPDPPTAGATIESADGTSSDHIEHPTRRQRPAPVRDSPIRNASTLFRSSPNPRRRNEEDPMDASAKSKTDHSGTSSSTTDAPESDVPHDESTIERGVRLGYRVFEDEIAAGKAFAQRMADARARRAPKSASGVNGVTERIIGCYAELGRLSLELLETVSRGPLSDALNQAFQSDDHRGGHAGITTSIRADGPTELTLNLGEVPKQTALAVHPLRALDPSLPPITEVSLTENEDPVTSSDVPLVLRVAVPPAHPPGIYTAAVVIAEQPERSVGSISLRVGGTE